MPAVLSVSREAERVRPLAEDERQDLLEGLKAKWEQAGHLRMGQTEKPRPDSPTVDRRAKAKAFRESL